MVTVLTILPFLIISWWFERLVAVKSPWLYTERRINLHRLLQLCSVVFSTHFCSWMLWIVQSWTWWLFTPWTHCFGVSRLRTGKVFCLVQVLCQGLWLSETNGFVYLQRQRSSLIAVWVRVGRLGVFFNIGAMALVSVTNIWKNFTNW